MSFPHAQSLKKSPFLSCVQSLVGSDRRVTLVPIIPSQPEAETLIIYFEKGRVMPDLVF